MTQHTQKKVIALGTSLVLIFGAFLLGIRVGGAGAGGNLFISGNENEPDYVDFSPFWDAWQLLDEHFVNGASTTPEERVWGAIGGLAEAYGDPYTTFLPPEDTKTFNETISGNFGGVGMEIGIRNETLTVIAPLKNTPASKAGIRAGDQIILIDEMPTRELSLERAVQLIRGEVGEPVVLTIFRPSTDESMVLEVIRDTIQIPTIQTELRPDNVFVISLYNFSATSPYLFQNALREFAESGSLDLVIDVRGNPGGFLNAAVEITSWFLPVGKVIVREHFGHNKDDVVQRSRGYDVFTDRVDIAVLVDGGSASASEIFAGALQEHGKATLVGTQTFGKGSVQELIPLDATSMLKVTVAKWLTPNGTSISDGGLAPDVVVELTPEDVEEGSDPQLERAVQLLQGN